MVSIRSGRSKGREARPRPGQNFFIVMQFSGKIDQIVDWSPPPSPGNPVSTTDLMHLNFTLFFGSFVTSTGTSHKIIYVFHII